jgi:hypothetical protein
VPSRVATLLALIAMTALAAAPAQAKVTSAKAQRALATKIVHKYGVGTKATTLCKPSGGAFNCFYIASLRTGRVYVGNAKVDRRMRVRLTVEKCVGAKCRGGS